MKQDIGYDYEFTEDELSNMSDEMRDAILTVNDVQIEKKVQDSIFNEKIKTNQDRATKLANRVKDGSEIRFANCERVVNRQIQKVEWVDRETFDVRKTEDMETGDYQEEMPLPDPQREDNGGADMPEAEPTNDINDEGVVNGAGVSEEAEPVVEEEIPENTDDAPADEEPGLGNSVDQTGALPDEP